jgi:leucine efflux protein
MMDWFISPSSVGIVDFPTYLLGVIFTVLFPGPNSLYVLAIASVKGWRAGAWASVGIFIGDTILMMGVALGAATLLNSSPSIFNFLRMLGAAYLAWMGYGFIRSGLVRWHATQELVSGDSRSRYFNNLHPTIAALTLCLTNPKAIFFFISFFAQFIQPEYAHPVHTFLYLALVLQIVSMTYLISLICAGQFFLSFFNRHPHYAAALWFLVGALLIGFAGKLLLY